MDAPGYLLYLPPTALKARFVMVEEHSKVLYDVDLATDKLKNPARWASEGLTPANTGSNLAIVIPDRLDAAYKQRIASEGFNPNFETGRLVSITRLETDAVRGKVIGKVNICPFNEAVMSWEKLKHYKGAVIADEIKNGLLAKLYGHRDLGSAFVHPEVLARMPRNWHQDAAVLNTELDGMFASGIAVEKKWILSEDDDNSD